MSVELKVQNIIDMGREIELATPDVQQLAFVINDVSKQELEQLAAKYDAPLMAPNLMYNHYRTTILDGRTKIVLRSPQYNVSYQIMEQ